MARLYGGLDCQRCSSYTVLQVHLWQQQKKKTTGLSLDDVRACLVMQPGMMFTVGTTIGEILVVLSNEKRIKWLANKRIKVNKPEYALQH